MTLFKYKSANHRLLIETGSYDGTLFEDRKCLLCNHNHTGSESHYLNFRPYFAQSSSKIINFNPPYHKSDDYIKQILSTKSRTTLINVCKFINAILRKDSMPVPRYSYVTHITNIIRNTCLYCLLS